MTRGSTPRFDLYAELEVSRQATPAVIEAAYRALVKRHHPDVATPADQERIARLNVARDWLLSPTRRATYDGTATVETPRTRPRVQRTRRLDEAAPTRPARTSSPASFGVNSREVRQFLAELREIDGVRAASVLVAKSAQDAAAYDEARTAALAASRTERGDEWGFARDAASVIVRGKLAESPFARSVSGVVADVAGAIVVRDLLPTPQFLLLLEPWTQSKQAPAVAPVAAAEPLLGPRAAVSAGLQAVAARRPLALGILGSALAVLIAVALLGGGPADPDAAVAGLTSQPSGGAAGLGGTPFSSGPVATFTSSGSTGTPAAPSAAPTLDPAPGAPGPTVQPNPVPTSRPATATPRPTRAPAATPTATATPAPTVRPTPTPTCTVVDLIGVNSSNVQGAWSGAAFTGTVAFSPQPPPQYKIAWQSLAAGSEVACSSGITVRATAP